MLIDIHIHTNRYSSDSKLDPEEAILKAKESGLAGICFTDHNACWETEEIERLRNKYDYPLFSGVEIDTVEGHVLVFGAAVNIDGPIRIVKLRELVTAAGGFMIAAHPLKGFRIFNMADLNFTPEQAAQRPLMRNIDAIEIINGKCNERENGQAAEVAGILRLPTTGGSDAHSLDEIGSCVTEFEDRFKETPEFLAALKKGRYKAVKR
ncbi:MAG: PHP domain-containing protein [Dehalococcoidia bacterium]|nr:MAG: PHP domain-containing protein [Dehalococcoidia bacterium]